MVGLDPAPSRCVRRLRALAAWLAMASGVSAAGAAPWPVSFLQPTARGTLGLESAAAAWEARAVEAQPPALGRGPTLRPADRGPAILLLRARLAVGGEGPAGAPSDPERFDAPLEAAVRAFQRRHGLEPDGLVGPATRAELDRTPRDRLRQIARAIDSRSALPADLGRRHLLINLSAQELEAVEGGWPALRLRVIVGTASRPTPTFASSVVALTANPFWHVPARIAREELGARAAEDPDYLPRLGIEVFPGGGAAKSESLDPAAVDWDAFQCGAIDLALRQRPGPANALGVLAFRFETPLDIRLHDTPERRLFDRTRRDLSHGCIRVDRAVDLARWLLGGADGEVVGALEAALRGTDTVSFALTAPVPLYVVDWPAWVDASGALQMRSEIYPE